MTLVEVLVATAVLSMVGVVVWTGFVQTARNKDQILARSDDDQQIRVALERMQRELSMAYVSTHVNANPVLRPMLTTFLGTDRGDRDRIDFTSFSHTPLYRDAKESDQNELSYFVARHPERSRELVLARREQARIDDQPTRGGRVQILLERLKGLEIEYLDPQDWEWQSTWNATPDGGTEANRLPAQVRITITMEAPAADARRGRNKERVFRTIAQPSLVWGLNHASYQ